MSFLPPDDPRYEDTYGDAIDRYGEPDALWWGMNGQDTRRWAFYNLGAMMCAIDTGKQHGPSRG